MCHQDRSVNTLKQSLSKQEANRRQIALVYTGSITAVSLGCAFLEKVSLRGALLEIPKRRLLQRISQS